MVSPIQHDDAPLGLREQKKRRTRIDLCMAARRLTVERGLDATTVDDIAAAVGVSGRTFFNYYETKLDAVVGPVGEIGTPEARQRFIEGGPSGVLIDDLASLYGSSLEPESKAKEAISLVTEIIHSEPRVLAGFVAAGAKQEAAFVELLDERTGGAVSRDFALLAARLMPALTMSAAVSMTEDPDKSLVTALHEQCALAAQLFTSTEESR
ncbi:putative transcriptional regulator, TetR family [Nocardia nova SH22a]|uniref:Putative transcriptional regulator, TetR family n=1 Tax=Nocardia nova SH22a TaxID=1415166 RepID=W5TBI2_9NOCA|nr:putative transcriptional regulator, TetR family [Nocardia nova SH22a]